MDKEHSILKADMTINNDEIELINDAIQKIRKNLAGTPNDDEINRMESEVLSLLEIRKMLYAANSVYDPREYIVIDTMRIRRADYDKFFACLSNVTIEGFDVVKPLREGDYLPGTKNIIKVPRDIEIDETIDHYEDYLYKFYKKNGYNLPERKYVSGTNVYEIRPPYLHERYTINLTDNGYEIDKQFGSRNPYYRRMKRYYEQKLELALSKKDSDNIITQSQGNVIDIFKGAYVSKRTKNPIKVLSSYRIPTLLEEDEQKTILQTLIDSGKNILHFLSYTDGYSLSLKEKIKSIKIGDEIQSVDTYSPGYYLDKWNAAALNNPTLSRKKIISIDDMYKEDVIEGHNLVREIDANQLAANLTEYLKPVIGSKSPTARKVVSVQDFQEMTEEKRADMAKDIKNIIDLLSQNEQTVINLNILETNHSVKYRDLIEENFRMIDITYDEVVESISGKNIESKMPHDLLVALGISGAVINNDVPAEQSLIEGAINANESVSVNYPIFSANMGILSDELRKKVQTELLTDNHEGLISEFVSFEEQKGGSRVQ